MSVQHFSSATELLRNWQPKAPQRPSTPVVQRVMVADPRLAAAQEALASAGKQIAVLRENLYRTRALLKNAQRERNNYRRRAHELGRALQDKINASVTASVREQYGHNVGDMIAAVHAVSRVPVAEICSHNKTQRVVRARHILSWLIRQSGAMGMLAMGKMLNQTDHTGGVYAVGVVIGVAEIAGVSYETGKHDLVALVQTLWDGDWKTARRATIKNIRRRAKVSP